MKKLFENVEGNRFKLLTESVNGQEHVISGLKKVFTSDLNEISYKRIETVGLGYIKDVSTAQRVSLQEAKKIAESFGYKDDEYNAKFVKSTVKELNEPTSGFKHDMPKNDPVGEFLTMMADMPDENIPPLKVWKIIVGNANIALMYYKKQRTGTN